MANEITRRLHRSGAISEDVHSWHYRTEGAGEPGGRHYHVLYAPGGQVLIDVGGHWSSLLRTIRLKADEIRPQEEWREWLLATGQQPEVRRWCTVDGTEIPSDSDPEVDENCCSPECRNELRPDW